MSPQQPKPTSGFGWSCITLSVIILLLLSSCIAIQLISNIALNVEGSERFQILTVPTNAKAIFPTAVTSGLFRTGRRPDIAIAMWGDLETRQPGSVEEGSMAILLRKEDSTIEFLHWQEQYSGKSPVSIATGDFNCDHILDIAVVNMNSSNANSGRGDLVLFLGNGDGTFRSQVPYPALDPFPSGIGVADFDRNGCDDIVVGTNTIGRSGLTVFFFDPHFLPEILHLEAGGTTSRSISIADFNGDGNPDIAVANVGDEEHPQSSGITVFLSKSGPETKLKHKPVEFVPHFYHIPVSKPLAISTGRFTSKKLPDIAVLAKRHILILENGGEGKFTEVTRIAGVSSEGFNFHSIQTADFDKDGKDDIAYVDSHIDAKDSAIVVLLGNGTGGFKNRLELTRQNKGANGKIARESYFINIAVADIDGDGYPDILAPVVSLQFFNSYISDRATARLRDDAKGLLLVFLNQINRPAAVTVGSSLNFESFSHLR